MKWSVTCSPVAELPHPEYENYPRPVVFYIQLRRFGTPVSEFGFTKPLTADELPYGIRTAAESYLGEMEMQLHLVTQELKPFTTIEDQPC